MLEVCSKCANSFQVVNQLFLSCCEVANQLPNICLQVSFKLSSSLFAYAHESWCMNNNIVVRLWSYTRENWFLNWMICFFCKYQGIIDGLSSPLFQIYMIFDVIPSPLIDSNVSLKWKHWKSKESGHAPWFGTLSG